jgi:hypothetical protein
MVFPEIVVTSPAADSEASNYFFDNRLLYVAARLLYKPLVLSEIGVFCFHAENAIFRSLHLFLILYDIFKIDWEKDTIIKKKLN